MASGGNCPRVAIIGAGISGVVSAAHLLRRGVDVTVFERNSTTGGVWVYNEKLPPEPSYPAIWPSKAEVIINEVLGEDTPGSVDAFARMSNPAKGIAYLLDWPVGTPDYTSHTVMKQYIQDIAEQHAVNPSIRYGTTVLKAAKIDGMWELETRSRRRDSLINGLPTTRNEAFDVLIVAIGHYNAPRIGNVPGLRALKERYPSAVTHSKAYRGSDGLVGKSVLIIGTGASAIDIARDAAIGAKKIYHSCRGGKFDVPLSLFPEGITHVGEVLEICLTDNAGLGALNARFNLSDGSSLCDIDVVILCTGYQISLPFLAHLHNDTMPVDQATSDVLVTDGTMYHNLHKDIFYIPDPTLLFIGVPYYTANFSLFDFQAQAAAAVVSGLARLPAESAMRDEYTRKLAEKGAGKQFHSLRSTEIEYVQDLLSDINPQLVARGLDPLKAHTEEWLAAKREQIRYFETLAAQNDTRSKALPVSINSGVC